jgi:DeoD family purine-nucleoside phosphorylase
VGIHVRAQAGDYADACLLPGDPNRARWIAETHLEEPQTVNTERGLLGYTGAYEGRRISVQATGMGSPSAAIVLEELVELGVRRFLRVGTCGSLQKDLGHGDLVLALSAAPADGTTPVYTGGEPHCPTADWDLLHGAVHAAKELGEQVRVGPIVSADVFYDPDPERHQRWSSRGLLAVEMESAALFTIAALRGVQAGSLLAVTDLVLADTRARITDADLSDAVDRMTRIGLAALR